MTGALVNGVLGRKKVLMSDFPNLLAWFRPAGFSSSGSEITTWTNEGSESSYDATVPGGESGPELVTAGLNNRDYASFNGTDEALIFGKTIFGDTNPRTIYAVMRVDAAIDFATAVYGLHNGSNIGAIGKGIFTRNDDYDTAGSIVEGNIGACSEHSNAGPDVRCPDAITDEWVIVDVALGDDGVSDIYINGVLWAVNTEEEDLVAPIGPTVDAIGKATAGGAARYEGDIAELGAFSGVQADGVRRAIRAGLSDEYNIAISNAPLAEALPAGSGAANMLLIWGQSNASGNAELSDSSTYEAGDVVENAYIWTRRGWEQLTAGVNNMERISSGSKRSDYGPELAMAADIVATTGNPVYIVKTPDNGSGLEDDWWDDGGAGAGTSYADAIAQAADAEAALADLGYTPAYSAVLWVQGEKDSQDAQTTQAGNYDTNLAAMIADARSTFSTAALPFIISKTHVTAASHGNLATVQAAQLAVAQADANVFFVQDVENHTLDTDGIHRTADGYDDDAADYALAYYIATDQYDSLFAEYPFALWVDAKDSSTITLDGSTVEQWDDKSGNNNHAIQLTPSAQPTPQDTAFNGKPTLRFAGDSMSVADDPSFDYTSCSIFVVSQYVSGVAGVDYSFWRWDSGDLEFIIMYKNDETPRKHRAPFSTNGTTIDTVDPGVEGAANVPNVFELAWDGTDVTGVLDDADTDTSLSTVIHNQSGTSNPYTIGHTTPDVQDISEIMFATENLTTAQRSFLLNYIGIKWSIELG